LRHLRRRPVPAGGGTTSRGSGPGQIAGNEGLVLSRVPVEADFAAAEDNLATTVTVDPGVLLENLPEIVGGRCALGDLDIYCRRFCQGNSRRHTDDGRNCCDTGKTEPTNNNHLPNCVSSRLDKTGSMTKLSSVILYHIY
jgi:hypothetical protein